MAIGILLVASSARAQPSDYFPKADLDYQVLPGLTCPTAEQLRADVAKEMAYDALGGGPRAGRFHVGVSRDRRPGVLLIRVSYDDVSGKQDFETEFTGNPDSARSCAHLVQKHVVAEIALQFTLEMTRPLRKPQSAASACPASKPCPACVDCKATRFDLWPAEMPMRPLRAPEPDPAKPPERLFAVRIEAAVSADFISDSGGSLGVRLGAGVRWRAFTVEGEGQGDPALGTTSYGTQARTGSVRFARATGALMLCASYSVLVGCLKGQGGKVWFPGSFPALAAIPYAAAGVRLGLEFPVVPWFLVRLSGELLPTINPASATVGSQTVFQVARLNAGLGLGALFELGRP